MSYQFLPWVRSGAATAYTNADALGPILKRADGKLLTDLPVALRVNTTPVDVPLRLYGPGDVTGIDQRVVIRVDPPGGSADLEPNYLACIEFDTPDFPWMLTPASAGSNARLRPWLVLAVVRRTELRFSADRPLPVLSAAVAELPDLLDSWIWAHAQVVQGDVADPIDQLLSAHPQRNLSRLVCPRRLEPFTAYTACLVPAFEVGRLAGLGEEVTPAAENALAAAWDATKTQVELPVYFHWEFATGAGGDFETLADRLTGRKAGSAGRRPLNADDQPFGVGDPGRTLEFQGPLVAAETPDPPVVDQPFRDRLEELLKLDGVVTPPVYGSHQAGPLRANGPAWMRELNLDPAARAAAGLGARIVQERQEQLVSAAWQQLGDVQAVARLERRLELAVAVLDSVKRRHIEPLDAGRLVQLVGPAYARMPGATKTLRASLVSSGLPASFSSAPLRRALRPAGSLARRRSPAPQPQLQLVANQVATAVPAVGPAVGTQGLVAAAHVTAQLGRMGGFETPQQTRYRHAITQVRNYLDAVAGAPVPQPSAPMALTRGVWQTVVDGLDPAVTLPRRFYSRVTSAGERVARPEITGPSFPQPMYEALRDLSPELLLPGVGKILPDTVTVLASNTRTIEAFMAGLNQEFAAELLWREFPGDLRHTSFRHFWDGAPAMKAIHEWSAGLGDHFAAGNEQLVLLIRGELLRRYPDALIYAVNAVGPTTLGTVQKLPVFRGRIDPDITFLGFDLVGDDWFFVIEEQPSAPRFGMDEVREITRPLDDWNHLGWSDMRTLPGAQLKMSDIKPNTRPPGPTWAFNSAHMAAILRQRPVRVAFHAERLLP